MLFHHVIHDLEDWRQVFQDPDAFEPLIREIFRRHGLPFAGIGRCAPGSNAVFRCGGYIVKIFAPEESGIGGRDDFLTEKFGLLRAKRLSVPAPVLYAEGVIEDAHTFRYLLLEYVEGESLAGLSPRLSGGERFRIGRRLREIVDRMDVACEPFNSHALFGRAAEERWKAFPASFRREREMYLRQRYGGGRVDGQTEAAGDSAAFSEMAAEGRAVGRTAVYVHGDLNPDNILIRPDGRLCLIDFADAMRAPIELELASLLCDGFRFDADYLAGFLDAKKAFRQETFRNAAGEKGNLIRESRKEEGRREEKLAESLLFGLLIHDYGVNIIRDNIGAPERIPSLKTLRERLDYALLTGTQTS